MLKRPWLQLSLRVEDRPGFTDKEAYSEAQRFSGEASWRPVGLLELT